MTQTATPPHPAVPASYTESYRRKGEPWADGVGALAMRGPELFVGYLGQEQLHGDLLTEDTAAGKVRKVELRRFEEGDR